MSKYTLTLDDLLAKIATVEYQRFGDTGTLCVLTLKNGFTVTGTSGCIDPTIFDEKIGEQIAYDNAVNGLWVVEGYVGKQRWYEETQLSPKQRVESELADLDSKRSKLMDFLTKGKPENINVKQWELLERQQEVMSAYALILQERLAIWDKD